MEHPEVVFTFKVVKLSHFFQDIDMYFWTRTYRKCSFIYAPVCENGEKYIGKLWKISSITNFLFSKLKKNSLISPQPASCGEDQFGSICKTKLFT